MSSNSSYLVDFQNCVVKFNHVSQYSTDGKPKASTDADVMVPFNAVCELVKNSKNSKKSWSIQDDRGFKVTTLLPNQQAENIRSLYFSAVASADIDKNFSYNTTNTTSSPKSRESRFSFSSMLKKVLS